MLTCQEVKAREKAWHDFHIKQKKSQVDDLVLMYDNEFMKHPRKFHMHQLGLYIMQYVTNAMTVQLEKLNEDPINELVNGNRLKLYRDNCPTFQS